MRNYILIYSALSLFVIIASCNGQNQTGPSKDNINQVESNLAVSVQSEPITTLYGPKRITRNIIQDSKGNICFASYEGIIKYDGNSFTNFTKNEGLDTCNAWSVLEDKTGNIWIATDGAGVYRYDLSAEKEGGKSLANFTTNEGLAHNVVLYLYEDKTGDIWFATNGGASRYNLSAEKAGGKPFTNFTTKEGLPHNEVNVIIEDKTGKFWFGTRGDACVYDGKTFTTLTNKEGTSFNNIRSIIEDKKGNIWLGGDRLWRYNPDKDGGSFTNFTTGSFGWIYEDKKGNIWITTDAWANKELPNPHKWALSRYDEKSLTSENATATQIWTDKGMFFGILEDNEGSIWVGTLEGVFRYDGKFFNHFKDPEGKE